MRIGLVAGEASGDVLGAGLIRAIRARHPDATFEGVAGPQMIAAGCECWEPSESLAVMGLVEPLAHIPRLLRLRRELAKRWTASPPDVFVGIDAPDFNLGLEIKLRKAGIRTAHYVSPSIWAWRAGRVKKVKKAADTVLCILPFEPELYESHGVNAVFVGHPKAHEAPEVVDTAGARAFLGIAAAEVVAVMPGSRQRRGKASGRHSGRNDEEYSEGASRRSLSHTRGCARPETPDNEQQLDDAECRLAACAAARWRSATCHERGRCCVQASGTAVLEAALLRKPTVATYRVAWLTHLIAVKLRPGQADALHTAEPADRGAAGTRVHAAGRPAGCDRRGGHRTARQPERRHFISERFDRLRQELALDADQHAADAVIELARR